METDPADINSRVWWVAASRADGHVTGRAVAIWNFTG